MDNRAEVREFLTTRRAKISVQQVGLPDVGVRRVPGLRRTEVAALAGISIEYYSKLERGALDGVSASVLNAQARALQLDDAERTHLFDLAHAADGTSALRRPRHRPQRADGPSRHQPPRPSDALIPVRQRPHEPAQFRPLHLPRQRFPPLLPPLGRRGGHLRRHPAHRGGP